MTQTIQQTIQEELTTLQHEIINNCRAAGYQAIEADYTITAGQNSGMLQGPPPPTSEEGIKNNLRRWAEAKKLTFSTPQKLETWITHMTEKIKNDQAHTTDSLYHAPIARFQKTIQQKALDKYQEKIQKEIQQITRKTHK